ncbi:MAG TPA: alpha/beta hydrolase [Dehalococcoidia bacterium]|nr:alpha/beta hydrolase [Dehalococcoidia bacterium]
MTEFQPDSRYYESAGLRLHYLVWGDESNPPLLLVHGGRDNARIWDALAGRLAGRHAVYVPDLRGHGDSDWAPSSEYAIADFVADLAALLLIIARDREPAGRIGLIGHSRGGGIALRLAGTYPECFRRVVAIDGMGRNVRWHEPAPNRLRGWIERRHESDTWRPRVYPSLEAAIDRVEQGNPRFGPELARHLAIHGTRAVDDGVVWKFDPRVRFHPVFDFPDDEIRQFFGAIDVPVLLIRGDQSDRGERDQNAWSASFPDAKSIILPGVGHWVQHERPDELLALIAEFLAEPTPVAGD